MRLKDIREDRDITQQQIADYLHVKQNTYSQYESGKRQLPVDIVIALAEYYGVTTDYLLGVSDIPNPYIMKQNQKNSRSLPAAENLCRIVIPNWER